MNKGKGKIQILALALILTVAADCLADITSRRAVAGSSAALSTKSVLHSRGTLKSTPLAPVDALTPLYKTSATETQAARDGETRKIEIQDLPAGPNSAILFFCALGSAGVYHVGRSAKKINFTFSPDWYHSGGVRQVGHVHALDLDFALIALPAAVFYDQPADQPKPTFPTTHRVPWRLESQFILAVEAPRGPPFLS